MRYGHGAPTGSRSNPPRSRRTNRGSFRYPRTDGDGPNVSYGTFRYPGPSVYGVSTPVVSLRGDSVMGHLGTLTPVVSLVSGHLGDRTLRVDPLDVRELRFVSLDTVSDVDLLDTTVPTGSGTSVRFDVSILTVGSPRRSVLETGSWICHLVTRFF